MTSLTLHHHTAAAQSADQRRTAAEHRRSHEPVGAIALRRATASDERAVSRLAQLDEMSEPKGELLLAELDGRLVAALPLDGGLAIADPFTPTQEIVELMRIRANTTNGTPAGRVMARRLRRAASGLRHAA